MESMDLWEEFSYLGEAEESELASERSLFTYCKSMGERGETILAEWDTEKNMGVLPYDVLHGSGKKRWWKCKRCGNEYELPVRDRLKYVVGCPKCRRTGTSFSEKYVYFALKQIFPDTKHRYKEKDGLEYDIVLPGENIYIEYNGEYWHTTYSKNEQRKRDFCKEHDIRLIEIWEYRKKMQTTIYDNRVDYSFSGSDQHRKLEEVVKALLACMGVEKYFIDFEEVCSMTERSMLTRIDNSLLDKFPQLCKEWAYDLNDFKRPEYYTCGSAVAINWRCTMCKNVRRVSICSRIQFKTGCPNCKYNIFDGRYHVPGMKHLYK